MRESDDQRHWLEGNMHGCTYDNIACALEMVPASNQQLMVLALEEMRRPQGDRPEVYRLLGSFKR